MDILIRILDKATFIFMLAMTTIFVGVTAIIILCFIGSHLMSIL